MWERNIRGIGLEDICNTSNHHTANEAVVPNALPAFLHILLAGLDAEQPASRGVVVVTMVSSAKIASGQITNGGPIILVQPENEYTQATSAIKPFPDPEYFQYVEDQLLDAGIIVPLISNDASPK